ncbi:MAG TPA: hypothetical protein VGS21_08175 [Acidimicrobiales bacterium]|nr:hypothetical protein [Acidimicrobiales bacterium]
MADKQTRIRPLRIGGESGRALWIAAYVVTFGFLLFFAAYRRSATGAGGALIIAGGWLGILVFRGAFRTAIGNKVSGALMQNPTPGRDTMLANEAAHRQFPHDNAADDAEHHRSRGAIRIFEDWEKYVAALADRLQRVLPAGVMVSSWARTLRFTSGAETEDLVLQPAGELHEGEHLDEGGIACRAAVAALSTAEQFASRVLGHAWPGGVVTAPGAQAKEDGYIHLWYGMEELPVLVLEPIPYWPYGTLMT